MAVVNIDISKDKVRKVEVRKEATFVQLIFKGKDFFYITISTEQYKQLCDASTVTDEFIGGAK